MKHPVTDESVYKALRKVKAFCMQQDYCCDTCPLAFGSEDDAECFVTCFGSPYEWNLTQRNDDGTRTVLV